MRRLLAAPASRALLSFFAAEESVSLILNREIEDFPSQDQEKEVAELEPA